MKAMRDCLDQRAWTVISVLLGICLLFGAPAKASAATIEHEGTWGTCPWEITSDGVLIIHPGLGAVGPYNSWKNSDGILRDCYITSEGSAPGSWQN